MLGIHVLEKMSNGSGGMERNKELSGLAKASNTSFFPSRQYNASRDAVETNKLCILFYIIAVGKKCSKRYFHSVPLCCTTGLRVTREVYRTTSLDFCILPEPNQ